MDLNALYLRNRFWIDDLLNGSPIGKPYREIKFLSERNLSNGGGKSLIANKLYSILNYARQYCPFYKGITSDDLACFPVMNKMKLIDNYESIRVAVDLIPSQRGKLHIQSTSGSTGTPFAVPQDTLKRQRRVAELKYFGKVVGFNTHEKLIHLRTWNKWQSKTAKQIKTENIIPFDISEMGEGRIKELCELIVKEKAVCLRGYASSFNLIANYVKEHPMNFPSLKVCIAGSETLHDDVREKVKRYMHCNIISQYANEECGILAQERAESDGTSNVMYMNHSGYHFEFLRMDADSPVDYGELGRIVITDYHNHAFPLIRYDTGDVGILAPPNSYSNGHAVLGKLYGRRFDVCYTVDNQPFSPMTIGRTLKHFNQVAQWQFIQKDAKTYVLKVVMRGAEECSQYLSPAIIELKKVLGQEADFRIEKTDEIPVLASGKRKPVVNEWKR